MPTEPGSLNTTTTENDNDNDNDNEPTPSETGTLTPPSTHASPALSTRARWAIASVAGVGLLSLGLLGGMLIGQQMAPCALHNGAGPARVSAEQNSDGHHAQIPDQVRDHLKERRTRLRDERRTQKIFPEKPGDLLPSPSNPSPKSQTPSHPVPSEPAPNNG